MPARTSVCSKVSRCRGGKLCFEIEGLRIEPATFAAYKQRTRADPRVFSFDLAGYGTLQFPERNVFCLAGFSDKALQTMRFLEEDKSALLSEIEAIEM